MLKRFSFLFIVLLGVSCRTAKDDLIDQLNNALLENPCLQEQEYIAAKQLIEDNPEEFPKLVDSTKKLNHYAFTSYTALLARNLKVPFDSTCCWIPEEYRQQQTPFNIHVFIENSASMDGYVKSSTQFDNTVFDLLTVFNLSELCDSMNLNYINQSIPYSVTNASDTDIAVFAGNLEPADFSKRGGNRASSDLQDIMGRVIQKVDGHNIAVLVTDCVFSPGSKNPDAAEFLEAQRIKLKNSFSLKLNQEPLCFVMFQLRSEFRGNYFDRLNVPHALNGELRPYYIMIAATPDRLAALYSEKIFEQVKWNIANQLVFEPVQEQQEANVKITRLGLAGECEIDNQASPRVVRNAVVSQNQNNENQFAFTAGVTFRRLFVPATYVADTSNYIVSNPSYALAIERVDAASASPQLSGYDYGMRLTTGHLIAEQLNVQLVSNIPSWVTQGSSRDDTGIVNNEEEQSKTFGLEYFVSGIYDAYCMHNNQSGNSANPYYILGQFTISIQPQK